MPFPWLWNINLQGSFEALLLPGNRSCVLWQCGLRCTLGVLFPIWSKLTECHNWHCQNVWRLALTWRIWSVRCHVSRVTRAGCTWTRPSRAGDTCENNATIMLICRQYLIQFCWLYWHLMQPTLIVPCDLCNLPRCLMGGIFKRIGSRREKQLFSTEV